MADTPDPRPLPGPPPIVVPARLDGRVVLPGDARYEEARLVANAAIDRRPAAIVLARDAADIVSTLSLARESGLPLAIRGGGHSAAGYGTADGAVVLDLAG